MDIFPLPAERLIGPEPLTVEEVAAYVVAAAVWAPSVHNTQPWWFSADGQEISLYADAGRLLRVADPRGREMMISCGAALFTARLALRSLGYIPRDFRFARSGPAVAGGPGELAAAGGCGRVRAAAVQPGAAAANAPRRVRPRAAAAGPASPMLQAGAERDGAMLRVIDERGEPGGARRGRRDGRAGAASWTACMPGNWPAGRPRRAAPGATGCRPPPTPARPERTLPVLPRPGLRPRPPLGCRRVQPVGGAPVRRARVPADDRR